MSNGVLYPLRASSAAAGFTPGDQWEAVKLLVFSEQTPVTLSTGGATDTGTWTDSAGDEWSFKNFVETSLVDIDANGLNFVQDDDGRNRGGAQTAPQLSIALSTLDSNVDDGDTYSAMIAVDGSASTGNNKDKYCGIGFRDSTDANGMFGGLQKNGSSWKTGATEWGDTADSTGSTSSGAERVIEVVYSDRHIRVFDHGSWSGSWPAPMAAAATVGAQAVDRQGASATDPGTFKPSSAHLGIFCMRNVFPYTDVVNFTISRIYLRKVTR